MSGNEDEVVFPDLAERGEAALEDSDGGDTGGGDSADTDSAASAGADGDLQAGTDPTPADPDPVPGVGGSSDEAPADPDPGAPRAAPDRRTVEVAETGTADDVQITRDLTRRSTDQDAPDRRTVEVAETGTAADTQITRDETSQPADTPTTAGADVSSIDLGEDDADEVARANAIAEGFRRASTIDEGESDAEEIARANTAGNVLEDTQAAGGDVSSVDVTGEPVAGGQTRLEGAAPPSDPEAAEGAPQPVLGAPGAVESAVGEGASAVGEFSSDLTDDVTENIVSPAAGIVGSQAEGQANVNVELTEEGAEVTGEEDVGGLADTTPETGLGRTVEAGVEGFGEGAVDSTVGAPAEVVSAGNTLADAGEFTATQIEEEGVLEGTAESVQAGSNVAVATGEAFVDQAQRNPVETLGMLSGGVVGASAVTPVSIRRTDIPTREQTDVDIETDAQSAVRGTEQDVDTSTTVSTATGERTVRGVEVSSPPIVPGSVADAVPVEGRTLAGTVDGRPTAGTPAVDINEVDFERAGGQFDIGNTFDPKGPFETEVFAESLRRTGSEEAAQRFATRREIQSLLSDTPSRGDVDAETVISGARDVPSEQTDEIIDAIDDLDATVKGSATSAAQAEAFRQPRDLDLAVPDEAAARSRLSEALAGTDQSVDDVFDLVEDPDFNDGAFISGGQRAESAITTDEGVAVNPITEEGIRKAQGGTTIRGRGTPDTDVGDAARVDVGPKPTGGDITRQKDIVDLSAISRSVVRQERERAGLLNPFARRRANRLEQQVEDLERQFDPEIEAAREPFQDIPMDPDARRLAADGLGVRRGPDAEIDRSPGAIRTDVGGRTPVPTGAGPGIDASSPSGGAGTVLDGTQTILGAGSGSGDGQATDESLFPGAGGSGTGSGGREETIRGGPPISGGGADDPSPPSDGPPASPGPRDESGGDSIFGSPPDSPTSSSSSGTTISSSPNTIASGGRPVRSEPDRRDPRVEDDDERERPDTTSLFAVSEDTFSSGILSAEEVLEDQ